MNFRTMQQMTTSHRCAECQAPLVLPWDGTEYRLVCGQHREHHGYERRPTMAQECQERERQMQTRKPSLSGLKVEDLF